MRFRLLAAVFALSLVAMGQTLTVEKLSAFLKSSQDFIKEGKMTDRELANYLSKVKLTERLDDRTIEDIQGTLAIGPKTLEALNALRDRTASLAAAKPVIPEPKPAPIPPPTSEEQGAILTEVRQYALNYSKTLPDFICTQVTRRFAAPLPGTRYGGRADSQPAWQSLDTLTIKLSYFGHQEDYKLMLVNGKPTALDYLQAGGALSTGEFGTRLLSLFEPRSHAEFHWKG